MDKMSRPGVINPKFNILAIILKGLVPNIGKRPMLHHTIESIKIPNILIKLLYRLIIKKILSFRNR